MLIFIGKMIFAVLECGVWENKRAHLTRKE
jgi:hypothetical protein